jgi:hypothetical protein
VICGIKDKLYSRFLAIKGRFILERVSVNKLARLN